MGQSVSCIWDEGLRNVREPPDVLYFGTANVAGRSLGEDMTRSEEFDVIIVGAGPAGLCAALYSGRGLLRSVLLERGIPGGELLNTEWIDDYLGFEHVLGRELAERMASHARKFGADIRQETVEAIVKRDDGIFEVVTALGRVYQAPTVIL